MKMLTACTIACAAAIAMPSSLLAQGQFVYIIEVEGPLEVESVRVIRQAIDAAVGDGISAVVLDMASTTQRFDHAQLIVEMIENAPVAVFAFVREPVSDAAALIALATDSIFMHVDASLGAGAIPLDLAPVALRAMRTAFESVAERHGRNAEVAAAMVDEDVSIDGLVSAGERLRLTAATAKQTGIVVAEASSLDDVMAAIGLDDAEQITAGVAWTTTTVSVSNRNWRDLRVFVSQSGSRFRLGTVTSNSTVRFQIRPGQLGPAGFITIVAEVIGSLDRIQTDAIRVRPGLVIQWNVENVLSHSSFSHYVSR